LVTLTRYLRLFQLPGTLKKCHFAHLNAELYNIKKCVSALRNVLIICKKIIVKKYLRRLGNKEFIVDFGSTYIV